MLIQPASKIVAVVVPLHMQFNPSADEELSLRHLTHFLGKYDKYMLAPQGLCVDYPGFKVKHFSKRWFGSAKAHGKMQLSPEFYKSFLDYKYILIYHLDALVFSDQLLEWCKADFDLIAPPWVAHEDAPHKIDGKLAGKVGNGGFALYKVASFLKVLNSSRYAVDPEFYEKEASKIKNGPKRWVLKAKSWVKRFKRFNNLQWEMTRGDIEKDADIWWATRAQHYYPEFKIAPVDVALRFGFECVPRYCFELTHHTLPFGCHAWQRYDREFWEPFLLK